MKILVLMYTLCGSPQYLTLIEGNVVTLWNYDYPSLMALSEIAKKRETELLKIPLDDISEGQCT